jgi:hypothetical protein
VEGDFFDAARSTRFRHLSAGRSAPFSEVSRASGLGGSSTLPDTATSARAVNALDNVLVPRSAGTRITFDGRSLKLGGSIAAKDPCEPLASFFRSVHQAALVEGVSELVVDVSGLIFVSSSAIRLFADWATWLKHEGAPYKLVFRSQRSVSWQRTAFVALSSLARNVVNVEYVT